MRLACACVFAFVASACGGGSNSSIDAPKPADAKPSSVKTVACPATPAATVTVVGTTTFAFSPQNPSVHVNDVVRFMTTSMHPVGSGTPSAPDGQFMTTGDDCLQFTAAGSFPFFCEVHLFTGTVTVQ